MRGIGSRNRLQVKIRPYIITAVKKKRQVRKQQYNKSIYGNAVKKMIADHSDQQGDKNNINGIKVQHTDSRYKA